MEWDSVKQRGKNRRVKEKKEKGRDEEADIIVSKERIGLKEAK